MQDMLIHMYNHDALHDDHLGVVTLASLFLRPCSAQTPHLGGVPEGNLDQTASQPGRNLSEPGCQPTAHPFRCSWLCFFLEGPAVVIRDHGEVGPEYNPEGISKVRPGQRRPNFTQKSGNPWAAGRPGLMVVEGPCLSACIPLSALVCPPAAPGYSLSILHALGFWGSRSLFNLGYTE